MSSILKALKKLEQEKAVHKREEINLSREILQDKPPAGRRLPWQWRAAIIAIILLALVAVILLWNKPKGQMQANTQAPSQQPSPPAAPFPAPVEAPPVTVKQQPAAPAEKPAASRVPVPGPARTRNSTPSPRLEPKETAGFPPLDPVRQQPTSKAEEPSLSVSGIAWNKDSSERLAIVNGQPLTIGSVIGNAIVEEIFKDRVRFSSSGRSFDIAIGKSGHTN